MSSDKGKQSDADSSVETVINELMTSGLPIKSLAVVHDVLAGVILGEADDTEHELELASGVSYIVIGVGKLPTQMTAGINFVQVAQ